jgi:hypothetical protein
MGLLIVITAWASELARGGPHEDQSTFAVLGVFYAYLALVVYRTRLLGRRRKAMVARAQALAGSEGGDLQG